VGTHPQRVPSIALHPAAALALGPVHQLSEDAQGSWVLIGGIGRGVRFRYSDADGNRPRADSNERIEDHASFTRGFLLDGPRWSFSSSALPVSGQSRSGSCCRRRTRNRPRRESWLCRPTSRRDQRGPGARKAPGHHRPYPTGLYPTGVLPVPLRSFCPLRSWRPRCRCRVPSLRWLDPVCPRLPR
jgi:hypothetical protein